jgi:hypothetical protein
MTSTYVIKSLHIASKAALGMDTQNTSNITRKYKDNLNLNYREILCPKYLAGKGKRSTIILFRTSSESL